MTDSCRVCGAYVESSRRHREWHESQDRTIDALRWLVEGITGLDTP